MADGVRCSASRTGQVVPDQDSDHTSACQTARRAHRAHRRADLSAFLNAAAPGAVLCSDADAIPTGG